jgi:hypothetical protein
VTSGWQALYIIWYMASTNNQTIISDQIPICNYSLVIMRLGFLWNLGRLPCLPRAGTGGDLVIGIYLTDF